MTGAELRAWREELGITMTEAARRLNETPYRTYQDWELGNRTPPRCLPLALREVARVLRAERDSVAVEQNAALDALRARSSRSGRG